MIAKNGGLAARQNLTVTIGASAYVRVSSVTRE